jgi:hypothetical protein
MDIEEFYDGDERRRESEELELGNDWHDAVGHRYVLSYVESTGELYLMAAPDADALEDGFGDIVVDSSEPVEGLTVQVVAVIPTTDDLHRVLDGWQDAMSSPSSTDWLREKVATFATP